MKHNHSSTWINNIGIMAMLLALCAPMTARAFTEELVFDLRNNGVLRDILKQITNNGGIDKTAQQINNKTMRDIADANALTDWERDGNIRRSEIAAGFSTSQLPCAIATVQPGIQTIDAGSRYAVSMVISILNGLYKDVYTGTTIADKKKENALCALGMIGVVGDCKTPLNPLTEGFNTQSTIFRKMSIPCKMSSVVQDIGRMQDDNWKPTAGNEECIAAIMSLAEFIKQDMKALPSEAQLKTMQGQAIAGDMRNQINHAMGGASGLLANFAYTVSLDEATLQGCNKGIKEGQDGDMYSLLKKVYPISRPGSPLGLPPAEYCLSNKLVDKGMELIFAEHNRTQAAEDDLPSQIAALRAMQLEQIRRAGNMTDLLARTQVVTQPHYAFTPIAPRPVATTNNEPTQNELLGAIRQLTKAIGEMNTQKDSAKPQEVRFKNKNMKKQDASSPATHNATQTEIQTHTEVRDALKDLGLTVGSHNPAILAPITPEFPTIP